MRAFSFIAALAVLVVGPSIAGPADLPGDGTFAYSGPSVSSSASPAIPGTGRGRS
jgi:hypothetical protein